MSVLGICEQWPGRTVGIALAVAGCAPDPIFDYDTATPPLVLVPATEAGVIDGRGRFREIFCALNADHGADLPHHRPCDEALHRLSGEPPPTGRPVNLGKARLPLQVVVVPGVAGDCFREVATPFEFAFEHLDALGYRTEVLDIEGLSGSARNAVLIRDALLARVDRQRQIVLLGYSKGTVDILEALAAYPEIAPRVAAMVSVAGAVNGSPLAEDAPEALIRLLEHLPGTRCNPGDYEVVESLLRTQRLAWRTASRLPDNIRYYSVAAFAEPARISAILQDPHDDLSLIDPRNDSQVLFYDQIVPHSVLLGYANGDHWAVTLDIARENPTLAALFVTQNEYPREVLLEAIVKQVEEDLADQSDEEPERGGTPTGQGGTNMTWAQTRIENE